MFYIGESSEALIQFKAEETAFSAAQKRTAPAVKKLETKLEVAPWGEDNRFPQNIVQAISLCHVAMSTIYWKSKALYGSGLVYGSVIDMDASGNEIFKVAKPGEFPEVDDFFEENNIPQYFAEFALDYYMYANTWEELIFNGKGDKIKGIVHQESPDVRWKQHPQGILNTAYLSKIWGKDSDQIVRFDPSKSINALIKDNAVKPEEIGKWVKELKALDMYFAYDGLMELKDKGFRGASVLYPINYPSPNKTYYQLAQWDAVRANGWTDISAQVPNMLKSVYKRGMAIKYHIEIPNSYFVKTYGAEAWKQKTSDEQTAARKELARKIDEFLAGSENAYKTLTTFFDYHPVSNEETDNWKIKKIDSKNDLSNELLTGGTANSEIMIAMGVNPNILGAGKPGGVYASNQGGSNIREGSTEHQQQLTLDRQIALGPFNLIKKYNKWPKNVHFRFKDTVMLTLDNGKPTETKLT